MINEKNATYMYVGNVANGIADEASYEGMANGSVAVVRCLDNKNEESAISGTTKVRIVQRKADGTFVFSPVFDYASILSSAKSAYSGNIEQVSYFGYNGVTDSDGFGTITLGKTYSLSIVLNHSRNIYHNAPQIKTVPYVALTTAQADMAKGIQEQFIRTFSQTREPHPTIKCERVSDTTSVAAITGSATIYKVTHGSKTVQTYIKAAAGNTTLTASTASVNIGDVINAPSSDGRTFTFTASALGSGAGRHVIYIGETSYNVADAGDAAANSTAIAAAINAGTQATCTADGAGATTITYNVNTNALPPMVLSSDDDSTFALVAVTIASGDAVPVKYKAYATTSAAATFTLDVEWQGATGYIYEGTTAATNIGITTLTGYWGNKFTGIAQPFDPINDSMVNQIVNFDITSNDFVSASEYKAILPKYGNGTWQQVSYQETYSQFLDKSPIVSRRPRTVYRQETVPYSKYNLINLTIKASDITSEATGLSFKSLININIAIKSSLSYDNLDTVFGL